MIPPTPPRAPRRSVLLRILATLVAAAPLAACGPTPVPTPTPTAAFASEEEAFAAAEKAFDLYVDALNAIDTSNPETFESLFDLSSGSVESADRKNFSSMYATGQVISGLTRVLSFEGVHSEAPFDQIISAVCLDVSQVTITNPDGSSAVSPDRPDVYALEVTFLVDAGEILVDSADSSDAVQCPAP
ncbi:hypothetical protein [Microbacterium algeriense]|uniref:Nuclear transport factor 2 family protein n=1 Tax=Microbacterium algeriense TaxID=2615184 RepID=A0ABQ6V701_9MICO|nr:hypothetical protein [Microbacterium algeriense]KAB1865000.1 hypothetical protein F6A08_13175 [Microbacterium algeriense]